MRRQILHIGRRSSVAGELIEAARVLELHHPGASSSLGLVLGQPCVHPDIVRRHVRCLLVPIGVDGTNLRDWLRRAEQLYAEETRPTRNSTADAQIFQRWGIVNRQRLDQADAIGSVGDFEQAMIAIGILVVN